MEQPADDRGATTPTTDRAPRVPPRWFVRAAWRVHRALYRLGGGRVLWRAGGRRGWGALRLTTVGRRSGEPRSVLLGYLEDGPNLVTLAMNGWADGHPAWWLNLREGPEASVRLADGEIRRVRAHEAVEEERERLWRRWSAVDRDLDGYAALRTTRTPVVVLEPVDRPER